MKRYIVAACASAALCVTACGGTGTAVTTAQLAKDKHVQKDEQMLSDQAAKCFLGPKSLTAAGRDKYMTCLVPPSRKAAANACLTKELQKRHIPIRRAKRVQFMQELATCIVESK